LLINCFCLFSPRLTSFAWQVFGLQRQQVRDTPAYKQLSALSAAEAESLLFAKVLAYAPATWVTHASGFKEFSRFCEVCEIYPLECVPQMFNLFILSLAQKGISLAALENKCKSVAFCLRFQILNDITCDPVTEPIKRFAMKVCPKNSNVKTPFGSAEVRKIWDHIERKYENLSRVPLFELRTFVLAVTQYESFCRFSDLAGVKLSDVVFDLDYFKIVIQYSKTDQAGAGQEVFVLKSVDRIRDPHMLMCLYLQRLDSYNVDDLYLFPSLI
jgi:hypothetical protein